MPRCPTCNKEFPGDPKKPYYPFCSERCKMIDLGKWLDEEYKFSESLPSVEMEEDMNNEDD